jgi:hypothetical protein
VQVAYLHYILFVDYTSQLFCALSLFDDVFNIMFLRKMMKLNLGHYGVFLAMTYKKEVNDVFELNNENSNKYFAISEFVFCANLKG